MPSEIKVLAPSHQLQEQKTPKLPRKISCVLLGGEAAGKTSLLRRYFHGRFEDHRRPTLGADFYTRRIPWTTESDSDTPKPPSQPPLSMQVWDTPGRERFAANRKAKYTAAFPDSFFKNVDVALLVYDMTSSASFTHALKWHADLVARIQRMEAAGERTRPFPILVAATKMDIKARDTHPSSRPRSIGNQRAVMGFNDFKGKEIRYEYTANQPSSSKSKSSKKKQSQSHRKRLETSTYAGVGVDQISYLEDSFFTNDARGSYLESLLSTEDGSDPDRDMVLLWCHRNGLSHHEVSSLDGTGIDHLMNEMKKLALESAKHVIIPSISETENLKTLYKWNDELDLHKRYTSKKNCLFPPFHKCCGKDSAENDKQLENLSEN